MKKIMMFTTAAFLMCAPIAMAEEVSGDEGSTTEQSTDKPPQAPMMDLFARHDADHDGVVSKDEFLKVYEDRFMETDTDGDGKITQAEMQAKLDAWKKKKEERRAARKAERAKQMKDAPVKKVAPKAEETKVETPKADAKKAETPAVEAPVTKAPATTAAPVTEAPAPMTAPVEAPKE